MNLTKKLAVSFVAASVLAGAAAGTAGALTRSSSSSAMPRLRDMTTSTTTASHAGARSANATDWSVASTTARSTVRSEPAIDSRNATGVVDARMMHRPGQAVAGTDTGQWSSMYDFMSYVVQDTAAVWNWYYQQWGRGQSTVHYVFSAPGQVIRSGCGANLTDDGSPFYCPADDTIYFAQVRAQWYWRNAGGDFGVAAAIAHEYGHNVQNELGISRAQYGSARFEQHADCLSGAFTHIAYYQGILDANDINEGLASRAIVGDEDFSSPDHHGTPQERMTAWKLGYDSAGPAGCNTVLGS